MNREKNQLLVQSFSEEIHSNTLLEKMDPQKPIQQFFTGFYEQTIEIGEELRTIKVLIPEASKQGSKSLHIAIPSGVDTVDFLEKTGWLHIAEKNKVLLFAYEPKNQQWNTQSIELEINYIETAFKVINERKYYNCMLSNYYFVGYEEGGSAFQQFIMAKPELCAAMAIFNGSEQISLKYMEKVGSETSEDPHLYKSEVPVPVWIISGEITEITQNVINYWLKANHCENTAYQFEDGRMYPQSLISREGFMNQQKVGKVQVTEKKVDYYDRTFNEKVWNEFMSTICRFASGIYSTALRAALDFDELGIKLKTMELDGATREWYEYVPKSKRSTKEKLPLVVALHGIGQTGEVFVGYSEWHKVAEERGFIVVFPTGSLINEGKYKIPKPGWNMTGSLGKQNDFKFIAELVRNVKSRNLIDDNRVYISGQSMGAMMTNYIAMTMPDIFAAAGATSAPILQFEEDLYLAFGMNDERFELPSNVNTKTEIPLRLIIGEHDLWGEGSYENSPEIQATLSYWTDRNKAGTLDEPLTYRSGIFYNRIYVNDQKVPMVQYTITKNRGHNCVPEEMWLLWDEWFSKYSREEDGSISYMKNDFVRNKIDSHRIDTEYEISGY